MPPIPKADLRRFEAPNGDWQINKRGWRVAAGVYRLRNSAAELLYVGLGYDPSGRIQRHATRYDWWPEVDLDRSEVEWFRRYEDADLAEKVAIRTEHPRYNMIHSLTRPHWSHERGGTPRPAEFNRGAILDHATLRKKIQEVIWTVRMHRRHVFVRNIANSSGPVVAVVPVELARLADRLGGADAAGRILMDYIRERQGDL